jgi:SAM-dependent methyltransferase
MTSKTQYRRLVAQRPNLQCAVLNFGYDWMLENAKDFDDGLSLLDVGCRNSGFPAWATKLGYRVTACELDPKFLTAQAEWKERFNVDFDVFAIDVRSIVTRRFDITTSFCAIQHSAEKDIECYEHIARITDGQIFIMTEFDPKGGRIERGRDDGDMRIYGRQDVLDRIIDPITRVWGGSHTAMGDIKFAHFDHPTQKIDRVASDDPGANMIFLEFTRQ